jgi:hypothetical protein
MAPTSSYKPECARALNLPLVDDWDVFDEDPENHLVLVHTTEDADLRTYGWVKGIILDTTTWKVVCQSYGASTTVSLMMTRALAPVYAPGRGAPKQVFRMTTEDGEYLELDAACLDWVDGYDGTLLRVWKYDGKVYVSSHKRIHTERSGWSSSPPFKQLYMDLGGPTDALFGDAEEASVVYTFLLVHPSLQIGSHVPMENPFMVYLGEHLLDPKSAPPPVPDVLGTVQRPNLLSMDEVNARLTYGFLPKEHSELLLTDPRLTHGEFVMCFEYTDATKTRIKRCIKVCSDAYTWRVRMRDNDPNLEHLVFQVAGQKRRDLRFRIEAQEFHNRYPTLALPTREELPYLTPRLVDPQDIYAQQKQIAIASLVFATHPKRQAEVLKAFDTYLRTLQQVRAWILRLDAQPDRLTALKALTPHGEHTYKRIVNILQVSHGRADKAATPEEQQRILEDSVKYLVENEYGHSLYRMYRVYQQVSTV